MTSAKDIATREKVERLCLSLGSVTPLQAAMKIGITRQNAHFHLNTLAVEGRVSRYCRGLYVAPNTKRTPSGGSARGLRNP